MTFEELQVIVKDVTKRGNPALYRDLFNCAPSDNKLHIADMSAWNTLPVLTKELLESIPLRARVFQPLSTVESIRTSSGTSGKPPLFSARAFEDRRELDSYNHPFHDFSKPTLIAGPLHRFGQMAHHEGALQNAIALDLHNMEASARVAASAGIDSMIVLPSLMPTLAPILVAHGIAPLIRYIEMSGDGTSLNVRKILRDYFPRARVASTYAISEAGGILAIPCKPMHEDTAEVFHEAPGVHLDFVDHESHRPLAKNNGAEGTLLATNAHGAMRAAPVIRYLTNDRIRIEPFCSTHDTWSFSVHGRWDTSMIKIPGGILQVAELDRVLDPVTHEYEAEYRELQGIPPVSLTIHLNHPYTAELASRITEELRLAPGYTYADGVREGLYAPLALAPLITIPGIKRRKLYTGNSV